MHHVKKVSRNKIFGDWPKYNIRLNSQEYKKKFKQCAKLSHEQLSCKKLFSKPEPKHETITAGEEYLKAREFLKLRIENTINFVESESRSITNNLKIYAENCKIDRATQSEELFKKTTQKLDKLISLDVSYGCWIRKEVLLLNDEIRRSSEALERALVPNAKRISSMLENLRSDLSESAELAEKSIAACRKHADPSVFAQCVKEQANEVTKMLDEMNEEARLKLKEITRSLETIVKAHKKTTEEVAEVNRKKAAELSAYLDRCVATLKKSSK